MRKYLLAGSALLMMATPAVAKDGAGYVGLDLGVNWPNDQDIFGSAVFTCTPVLPATTCTPPAGITRAHVGDLSRGGGWDGDIIGGYDFGMFRLEGELGYKKSKAKHANFTPAFISAVNAAAGTSFVADTDFNVDESSHLWDIMLNGWLDFGGNGGIGGGIGAGAGYAGVETFGHNDSKFAWQLLARAYGTNNLPDCSNMCHESSGVALSQIPSSSCHAVTDPSGESVGSTNSPVGSPIVQPGTALVVKSPPWRS